MNQLNILLIEDNEDDYIILRDLLRGIDAHRYVLEWAASYADGLEAIRAQRHDLILLDFRLSEGTGLELLAETHTVSRRAPVILMTGQGDHDIDVQAMQAGATDYLVKDRLDADLLERAIRYAVERQKSAEALRASEDRYRTFVENSTEGIWRFELEEPMPTDYTEEEQIAHLARYAYVAECNEAMASIYGYGHPPDILGARFGEFLSTTDDNYLRRLIHNQYRLVNAEAFGYDLDGSPKYILHNLIGVIENGLLYRIWGSQSDITSRKQSENAQSQLAAIVETSDAAIFSQTIDGLIVTWNKAAEALYGYTAQEVMSQPASILSPLDRREHMRLLQERIRRGERVPQFETVNQHKDSRLIDISLAISPIIYSAHDVVGFSCIVRDISEQKHAQRQLRQSEANMAAAQHIAHFGSWKLDINDDSSTSILRWSDETFRIFGYEPGSVPASRELFYQAVPPEEHHIVLEAVAAAIAHRQPISFVHRVLHSDGSERIVRQTAQFFDGEEPGQNAKLVGTVHDITEQRRAEDALKESEFRYHSLFENMLEGYAYCRTVFEQDRLKDFVYLEVNSAFEALTGLKDVIGKKISEIIPGFSEANQELFEMYGRVALTGKPEKCETYLEPLGIWLAIAVYSHEKEHFVAVFDNITERKQAELLLIGSQQRLALATESAQIGIWDWDVVADNMFWDAQMYALYGIREQDFSGAYDTWQKGLHPEDRKQSEAEIRSALDGESDFRTHFRVVWPGGEVRYIEAHALVLRAGDGTPQRMIGVNRDITDRKLAENERDRVEEALRASEQRLRLTLESGQFGTFQLDLIAGQYTAISDVGRRQFAFLPKGDVFTKDFFQRVHPDDLAEVQAAIVRAAAVQERDLESDYRIILPDGSVRWINVHCAISYNDAGVPMSMLGVTQDITDRVEAQEALQASEQRFRSVVETVESLVIHDKKGHLIDVNKNAWDSLGYTREEMLQLRVQDYELNYKQKGVARLWKQLATSGKKTAIVEGLHRRRDGTTFPVEVRVGLMEYDGTSLMVAVARDVTDRKQAQVALQGAEREQRQLAAHLEVERARLAEAQTIAKVGSWDLDLRTDILTWSDETYRIFGVDPAKFLNTYQSFLQSVHPDDRENVNRAYKQSVADRTAYEIDHRVLNSDGSITYVHERCRTFYSDAGQPLRSIGTAQDVTESHFMVEALRQSEHKFRRIIETTHEGVLQLNAEREITYVNQRFCEMLGYTLEELLYLSPLDLMDDESRALAIESFERRREGVTEQFDHRFRHKDGSVVWSIVSASPLLNEEGQVIGSFTMITDITERKRLEAQMHQSEKLAALGELVAGVAHEINNPIAAILGNAELLEMHADPQVQEDAQTIQRMSQRVVRIVRSLLTFARPHEGSRREESVNTLVEHTLEMTAYKLRTAGVALELRLQEPSPIVWANAGEIQQILMNLILNAEHALRKNEGEKRVVILTGIKQTDGRQWTTVTVEDNGHGIPEEALARIFDPFFTTKEVGEGTGLGLSICHGIAQAHGGKLSVESSCGLGTVFTVALPSKAPGGAKPE